MTPRMLFWWIRSAELSAEEAGRLLGRYEETKDAEFLDLAASWARQWNDDVKRIEVERYGQELMAERAWGQR